MFFFHHAVESSGKTVDAVIATEELNSAHASRSPNVHPDLHLETPPPPPGVQPLFDLPLASRPLLDRPPQGEELPPASKHHLEGKAKARGRLQADVSSTARATHRNGQGLDPARECELHRSWKQEGSLTARDRLLFSQRPVIDYLVNRFARGTGHDKLDLTQTAYEAVMLAIEAFDPQRGYRLSTLSRTYVKNALLRFTMDHSGPVRMGTNQVDRKIFMNARRKRTQWENEHRRQLDEDGISEIAAELGVPEEHLSRFFGRSDRGDRSLDAPLAQGGDESGSVTFGERMACDKSPDEDDLNKDLACDEVADILKIALECLEEREAMIVRNRLLSDEKKTFAELGETLNISKERVRQLERRGLEILKEILEIEGIAAEDVIAA